MRDLQHWQKFKQGLDIVGETSAVAREGAYIISKILSIFIILLSYARNYSAIHFRMNIPFAYFGLRVRDSFTD